jgi:hypothetical protein
MVCNTKMKNNASRMDGDVVFNKLKTISILLFLIFLCALLAAPFAIADSNLFGHRFSSAPASKSDFILQVSNSSEMSNPYLYFKKTTNLNYTKFSINNNGTVVVPASHIDKQGLYEFYYADDNGRFPLNNSFKLIFTAGSQTYLDIAANLTQTDAMYGYCKPFSSSDYTCEYENMQALEIMRFANAYLYTRNSSMMNTAELLATSN